MEFEGDTAPAAPAPGPQSGGPTAGTFMVDPAGAISEMTPEQVMEARANGYVDASPEQVSHALALKAFHEKYGGLGGELKAGGLAAARALTFGLSDVALTGTGILDPEDARSYAKENPISDTIGTIAGIAAPFIATGGMAGAAEALPTATGVAARVTAPAATARLGSAVRGGVEGLLGGGADAGALRQIVAKTVASGAGSAVEAAAYGAGQVVSEAALGDPNLTAESALRTVGLSAALGFAAGGTLSGAWNLGKEVMPDAIKDRARQWIDDVETNATLKSTHAPRAQIKRLLDLKGEDEVNAMVREGKDMGIVSGIATPDKIVQRSADAMQEYGSALGKFFNDVDAAGQADTPTIRSLVMKARNKIAGSLTDMPTPARQEAADRLNGFLDLWMKRFDGDGPLPLDTIWQMRRSVDSEIGWAKVNMPVSQYKQALIDLRFATDDAIKDSLPLKLAGQYKDLKRGYEVAAMWNDLATRGASSDAVAPTLGFTSKLAAGAGGLEGAAEAAATGHNPIAAGAIKGAILGTAVEAAKEYGPAVTSALAGGVRKIMEGGVADWMPDVVSQVARGEAAKTEASLAGKYVKDAGRDGALANLVNETGDRIVAERRVADLDPTQPQPVGQTATPIVNSPEQVALLAWMERMKNEANADIQNHIRNMLSGRDPVTGRQESLPGVTNTFAKTPAQQRKLFKDRVQVIQRVANDPNTIENILTHQTDDWHDHAPATAQALNVATARAVAFLASKVPQVMAPTGPLSLPPEPSADQVATFNRYWDAVENPIGVLKQARANNLSPQAVEARAAVYTATVQQIQQGVMERLTELRGGGQQLPYQKRLMLTHLMGQDMDGTMGARTLLANQNVYGAATARQQQQQAQQQQKSSGGGGDRRITLGSRMKTETQAASEPDDQETV